MVTPNKYDYVSLIATLTPHWFHQRLVSRIFGVSEDDVFPTLYRANTRSAIRKAMAASGLAEKQLISITHYPAYLTFYPIHIGGRRVSDPLPGQYPVGDPEGHGGLGTGRKTTDQYHALSGISDFFPDPIPRRSEERRVGKEGRSRWAANPQHK